MHRKEVHTGFDRINIANIMVLDIQFWKHVEYMGY